MSDDTISLIVGLGNPGSGYRKTRHNAGFWFLDELAAQYGTAFASEKRFHGQLATLELDGQRCYLLKPDTYMNRSGQSVHALLKFYKIPVEQMLVVHDELDLVPGIARLKRGGGHGGHNGLRDIIVTSSGNNGFLRLRIGIGHPGSREEVVNYVLGRPSEEDRTLIGRAIDAALDVVPQIIDGRLDESMNRLHGSA